MRFRLCEGCGKTTHLTQDWAVISVPIHDLEVDVCSPYCGKDVMSTLALIPQGERREPGKRNWSVSSLRRHVGTITGQRNESDFCPQCGKKYTIIRATPPQPLGAEVEKRWCSTCWYFRDPEHTT